MNNKLEKIEDRKKPMPSWLIAVITIGSIIVFCGLVALMVLLYRKSRTKSLKLEHDISKEAGHQKCSDNNPCPDNQVCHEGHCYNPRNGRDVDVLFEAGYYQGAFG